MPEALGLHLAGITRVQPTAGHHHQARQPRTCAGCQGRQQFHPFRNTHQQPWHVGMPMTLRRGELFQRGARVVGPCRKVVSLHKARGAIGRWRGVCRVYARLVQHSHLRVQQAPKVAISQGPHTGAARARNDHHAVA